MDLGATAMCQDGAGLSERIAVTGAVTEASSFPLKMASFPMKGRIPLLGDATFSMQISLLSVMDSSCLRMNMVQAFH